MRKWDTAFTAEWSSESCSSIPNLVQPYPKLTYSYYHGMGDSRDEKDGFGSSTSRFTSVPYHPAISELLMRLTDMRKSMPRDTVSRYFTSSWLP